MPASFTATIYNKEPIKDQTISINPGYDSNGNILSLQRAECAGTQVDKFAYTCKSKSDQQTSVAKDVTGTSQPLRYGNMGRFLQIGYV